MFNTNLYYHLTLRNFKKQAFSITTLITFCLEKKGTSFNWSRKLNTTKSIKARCPLLLYSRAASCVLSSHWNYICMQMGMRVCDWLYSPQILKNSFKMFSLQICFTQPRKNVQPQESFAPWKKALKNNQSFVTTNKMRDNMIEKKVARSIQK